MANWAKLQEQLIGLPVVKRARHGIHFDKGNGEIVANFSGKPCHYQDTDGLWKPIDTRLLLGADGFYGCPHSPVKVKPDGRVKVTGSDYSQFTKLPGSPLGRVDGDKIVREFPGGYQELFVTEDGFREVITVIKPTFPIEKFLARQSGTLPSIYKTSPRTAVDANGNEFVITSDTKAFGDWLDGAVYPVTIDPDFAGGSGDKLIYGQANGDYAAARSTSSAESTTGTFAQIGQFITGGTFFRINRVFLLFDTSSIGAGSTVTQVNLKLKAYRNFSDIDFDIVIMKQDWSSGTREQHYDGCLTGTQDDSIFKNSDPWVQYTTYTSGNLSTTWISKEGTTYYSLISSRDLAGTENSGNEYVEIYMQEIATESYRPVLTVTYTAAGTFIPINMNAQMQNLSGNMRG